MKKLLIVLTALTAGVLVSTAATFTAKVPDGTKKCYVCGAFSGWSAVDAYEMTPAGENLFSLDLPEVTATDVAGGYKYLCGPDWAYVEKSSTGAEISNRTATGNPDVVGSWAAMPEWTVETAELTVNGIPRLVKVYVPEGYEESDGSYPVIYYNTVQQRFNDAGSDADCGDDFFTSVSWNAHMTMEAARQKGAPAYVMVQVCSLLAENTLEPNPEYAGTGDMAAYLQAFVSELMPAMESRWRVARGPENTTIVGADFGALFSLYASISRPDVFGRCVAMSPMLWINEGVLEDLAREASPAVQFYVSAGSREPQWMVSGAEAMAEALKTGAGESVHYTLFSGAAHDDAAWGASFVNVLDAIHGGDEAPAATVAQKAPHALAAAAEEDFSSRVYTLYGGEDTNNLERVALMVYTEDFRKQGSATPVPAFVYTNDIAASIKGNYYWNIAVGEDEGTWLYTSNKKMGFSSKKTTESWHNIAVFEDGSMANIGAHSAAFKVVTADGSVLMTRGEAHLSTATVKFPGSDKSFKINFGSVNTATDMGAMTPEMSVSENCIEAEIVYDFNLNKVEIREKQFGQSLSGISVEAFTAVPSVCRAGSDVAVSLVLSAPCDIELGCMRDFSVEQPVEVVKTGDASYSLMLRNLSEGLYSLALSLVAGDNRLDDAAKIHVRVLPAGAADDKTLTVNAYKGVDWAATERYKANFHTHTSQSFDTNFSTTQVVDRYKNAGYKILALTDHDANSYPWSMFSLYNPAATDRDPEAMGMLAIPGIELSKDRRNSWSEKTGGEFNHHNDFFTGRKGQEFMSLRESYAYTQAIGGMQIINHPGQYWSLGTEYAPGSKNSPEWHAENFRLYSSLVGLEVYNQGNRRPNDRILWDQVLTINMPSCPVWGYSCDDTHTAEQYFRNYQFMLMPELTVEALKEAMGEGRTVFSYEFTGSGNDRAPKINSITTDEQARTISIDTDDAETIEWIYSTHRTSPASAASTQSTVVGYGKTFDYTGFQGSYVRARLLNKYGETATQPFGFKDTSISSAVGPAEAAAPMLTALYDSASGSIALECGDGMVRATLVNAGGMVLRAAELGGAREASLEGGRLVPGAYIVVVATERAAYTASFVAR